MGSLWILSSTERSMKQAKRRNFDWRACHPTSVWSLLLMRVIFLMAGVQGLPVASKTYLSPFAHHLLCHRYKKSVRSVQCQSRQQQNQTWFFLASSRSSSVSDAKSGDEVGKEMEQRTGWALWGGGHGLDHPHWDIRMSFPPVVTRRTVPVLEGTPGKFCRTIRLKITNINTFLAGDVKPAYFLNFTGKFEFGTSIIHDVKRFYQVSCNKDFSKYIWGVSPKPNFAVKKDVSREWVSYLLQVNTQ